MERLLHAGRTLEAAEKVLQTVSSVNSTAALQTREIPQPWRSQGSV